MAHDLEGASTRSLRHANSKATARRASWLAASLHWAWIGVATASPPHTAEETAEVVAPTGPDSRSPGPSSPDPAAPNPHAPRDKAPGASQHADRDAALETTKDHGDGTLDDVLGESQTRASAAEIRAYATFAPNMWIPARVPSQVRMSAESVVMLPAEATTTWDSSSLTRFRTTFALRAPVLLGVELDPLVTVRADDQRGVAPAGRALVSFDTRFAAIGVGLGVRAVVYESSVNGRSSIEHVPRLDGVGFMRFGARDGLHFAFRLGGYVQIRSSRPNPHLPVTMQLQSPLAPNQLAFLTWRIGFNDEAPPYAMWTDVSIRVRVTPRRLADMVFLGVTFLTIDDRLAIGGGIEWRSRTLGEPRRTRRATRKGSPSTRPESDDEERASP